MPAPWDRPLLTGKDSGFMRVSKLAGSHGRDLGRVGTPDRIEPELLLNMSREGLVPVIAPIGADADGYTYNVNADVAAGRIAEAVGAEKLILLTDVEGVLGSGGDRISRLLPAEAKDAIRAGVIKGGMIPKVECCIRAVTNGVAATHVIDGRIPHALLLEIFTDGGVGTLIAAEG